MGKFLTLLLFLTGCAISLQPETNTAWEKTHWQENAGIVSLSTGWGKSHLCTGVLVAPQMVLSAAHCILHTSDTYIVYGCNDVRSSICKRVQVKHILKHPNYNRSYKSRNDIAIFITEEKVNLPLVKFASEEYYLNDKIKAVGFGERNNNTGILYQGYGTLRRKNKNEFTALLKKNKDPNPGDSGGPALVMEDGEYKLLGILSRIKIIKTKEEDYINTGVGVYTKVISYQKWIWNNIR